MTHIDATHWFGVPFPDLDCRHWLPYMEAETIGEEPHRKITLECTTRHGASHVPTSAARDAREEAS